MDNHPIPQDVTNFQFRLIGDMTLKQFGYIAGGVIVAWIALATPLFVLLKLLFAGSFILMSVILAFVPIEGRPADLMVYHFIKALFSPTQFIYKKVMPVAATISSTKITTQTPQAPSIPSPTTNKKQLVQVESFTPTAKAAIQDHHEEKQEKPSLPQAPIQPTSVSLSQSNQEMSQQTAALQQEVKQLSEELAAEKEQETKMQGTQAANTVHEKVNGLEKELQEVMQQKQELEKQLVALQKSLADKKQQVFAPSTAQAPQQTQHVKQIPKQMGTSIGVPIVPDVPNLVTGVVKDPRGNILTNILIEVKDKDANPVRAFKTNQLGQFASATPLLNGIYTISFEDPTGKQTFDSVEIQAQGKILLPIEVTSVDAREKLRQELFGSQMT